jgi:hypothetical protein
MVRISICVGEVEGAERNRDYASVNIFGLVISAHYHCAVPYIHKALYSVSYSTPVL